MLFYLGVHNPPWLAAAAVPFVVSARRMRTRRRPHPEALYPFGLDSGGFSELSLFGRWTVPPECYAREVVRWSRQTRNLAWAAVQDWMCEPAIRAKTGLAVADHQRLTVESYLTLAGLAPEVDWMPVLQGWTHDDYLDHVRQYERAGVRLDVLPLVGLGSVCRRQDTLMVEELIKELYDAGLALHAFGLKTRGLPRVAHLLASSDSMAWSLRARHADPLPGCTHARCNNCLAFALRWRSRVLAVIDAPKQLTLF